MVCLVGVPAAFIYPLVPGCEGGVNGANGGTWYRVPP